MSSEPAQEANHARAHGVVARAADALRHRSGAGQHAPRGARHPRALGAAHRAGRLLGCSPALAYIDDDARRRARVAHAHSGARARASSSLYNTFYQLNYRRLGNIAVWNNLQLDARRARRDGARLLLRRRELVVLVDVLAVHPRGRLHPARRAATRGSWPCTCMLLLGLIELLELFQVLPHVDDPVRDRRAVPRPGLRLGSLHVAGRGARGYRGGRDPARRRAARRGGQPAVARGARRDHRAVLARVLPARARRRGPPRAARRPPAARPADRHRPLRRLQPPLRHRRGRRLLKLDRGRDHRVRRARPAT